jgi:hypothetical protein
VKEQGDDHDDVDEHMMMIKLQIEKEENEKQNRLKAKVYLIRSFCFATHGTKWV